MRLGFGLVLALHFLISNAVYSRALETEQIAGYCKVWGYLKYYHPSVQSGKINWDSVFVSHLPKVMYSSNDTDYNTSIQALIELPGAVTKLKKPFQFLPKDTSYNTFDFGWIESFPRFSASTRILLRGIIQNYVPRENDYIKSEYNKYYTVYGQENYYTSDVIILDSSEALLELSRYWNAINYLYAYKKIMTNNWDSLLYQFIPRIVSSAGTSEHYFIMAELCAKINDCHAYYDNYFFNSSFGPIKSIVEYRPVPLEVKYVENKTVITFVKNSIYLKYGISPGDIILELNGKSIDKIRDSLRTYCGCSTSASIEREVNNAIFVSYFAAPAYSFILSIVDINGITRTIDIEWSIESSNDSWVGFKNDSSERIIEDSIVYLQLAAFQGKRLRQALRKYRNYKAIIFDARGGVGSASLQLSLRLPRKDKLPFANYYIADSKYPGAFKKQQKKTNMLGLRLFFRKYGGKVIFLINENNQSSDEFQLMQLKSDFDITLVGDSTSGTDGIASSFLIQKNALTYFSSDAVTYPDGTQIQRIGIKPDVCISHTIKGIQQRQDELLLGALNYIHQH